MFLNVSLTPTNPPRRGAKIVARFKPTPSLRLCYGIQNPVMYIFILFCSIYGRAPAQGGGYYWSYSSPRYS
ncbi:hypothetical protein L873DRAFT_1807513 [Choiromyces venosus 120613-1]|uniref:Uncharacterized protein n=1 Tax=Choiromyces venosus 120613-1 TaxID=1336337 RepID=A0A3N4JPS8_9PEZI|nr:hypothetical protein L873DRAFT_1807513 [Choiromyces venosus 120613-1]